MKSAQTSILMAAVAVAAGMLLYPPFHIRVSERVVWKMGYSFLFDPPKRGFIEATINYEQLGLQLLAVAVAAGVLGWLAGRR